MLRQRTAYSTLLLLTTTLVAPAALAQVAPSTSTPAGPPATSTMSTGVDPAQPQADTAVQPDAEQGVPEVSAPGIDASSGGDIVVVGRNIPNTVRSTAQVISVLSSADIARTGEGDIAGALTRVTGLSVVGNGYVFVRGLGDR